MLKGLLAPRSSDTDPWLMPIMHASRRALHGDSRRWLYPKRTIWVDTTSGSDTSGDGSYDKPLQSLEPVLDDDVIECVCRHLCVDKVTVRVKGDISASIRQSAGGGLGSELVVIDGRRRDYRRRLVIRPWEDGERLRVMAEVEIYINVADGRRVDVTTKVAEVQNLFGVKWINADFHTRLRIYCNREPEKLLITTLADIIGLTNCPDSILMNCRFTSDALVDVLWRDPAKEQEPVYPEPQDPVEGGTPGDGGSYNWPDWPPAWDDWGGSGGGYGWPGGGGGGGGGDDERIRGFINAYCRVIAALGCPRTIARGGHIDIGASAYSNTGAQAECYGFLNCPGLDVLGLPIDVDAYAEVKGGGAPYSNESGSGIAKYSLEGLAFAGAVQGCGGSRLMDMRLAASAKALCQGSNTPHHTSPEGDTKAYAVGGQAAAAGHGLALSNRCELHKIKSAAVAEAVHPEYWEAFSCAGYRNPDTAYEDCTASQGGCAGSSPGGCEGLSCDAFG